MKYIFDCLKFENNEIKLSFENFFLTSIPYMNEMINIFNSNGCRCSYNKTHDLIISKKVPIQKEFSSILKNLEHNFKSLNSPNSCNGYIEFETNDVLISINTIEKSFKIIRGSLLT